jgi:hypothetical protein
LIASLSSKSEKRFLVNFQIKKPTMPMSATPPATERPTMEPVDNPESSSLGGEDAELEGAEADGVV